MKLVFSILLCFALCAPGMTANKTKSKKSSKRAHSATLIGWATFYTREESSDLTASGKPYIESAFICALPFHPPKINGRRQWGQKYRITNLRTGLSITVSHQDFGPGKKARRKGVVVDLTPAAFRKLGGRLKDGRLKVKVEKI